MTDYLLDIDNSLHLFLNSAHCPFFDSFMSLYSGRFIWIPMYVALLIIMLRRYPLAKVLILLIGIALSITLADQICASVLRPVFQRLRPSNLDNPISEFVHIVNGYRGGAYGFPSCHAANSFALAVFAAMLIHRRSFTAFILIWAAINCYSRIYLGVHYPGDLLVGGVIGAIIGCVCFLITKAASSSIIPSKPVISLNILDRSPFNLMELVGFITLACIIIISTFQNI